MAGKLNTDIIHRGGKPVDIKTGGETVVDVVFLDFQSDDKRKTLDAMEKGIKKIGPLQSFTTKVLCLALHRIQSEGLYRAAGFATFGDYLADGRIPVPKSTGSEYAKIGKAWKEHEDRLSGVGFTEADGLKKLLFLDRAIQHAGEDDALDRLGTDSLRDFQAFARGRAEKSEGGSRARTIDLPLHRFARLLDQLETLIREADKKTRGNMVALLQDLADTWGGK